MRGGDSEKRQHEQDEAHFIPAPKVVNGPEGSARWRLFDSKHPGGYITVSPYGKVVHCNVCWLICSLARDDDQKGFLEGLSQETQDQVRDTPGSVRIGPLMLCKRHHNLMKSLVDKDVPLSRWPSQLVRGVVYHYYELIKYEEGARDFERMMAEGAEAEAGAASAEPATEQKVFPKPIFGMGWTPAAGPDSITGYNFFYPMSVSRPNREAQEKQARAQAVLSNVRRNMAQLDREMSGAQGQHAMYNQVLQDLLRQNPPRFKSCLHCGQSEIPISAASCPFCGVSTYTFPGQAAPVDVLVKEVDPDGVVPEYGDLISESIGERKELGLFEREPTADEREAIDTAAWYLSLFIRVGTGTSVESI